MKLKLIVALLLVITCSFVLNRSEDEFEGIIKYKISIKVNSGNIDTVAMYKAFGRETVFYYKNGSFKWKSGSEKLEYEIFNPTLYDSFYVDKYHSNDTLYLSNVKTADSVIDIKKAGRLKILGYDCQGTSFVIENKTKKFPLERTLYYSSKGFRRDPAHLKNVTKSGDNVIFRTIKAVPLRMELGSKSGPFQVIYEAVDVQKMSLKDEDFDINKDLPLKRKE